MIYSNNQLVPDIDFVFQKFGSDLGSQAVKAVEIGDGFDVVNQKGTEHRDEITPEGFLSNHAGGVLGGGGYQDWSDRLRDVDRGEDLEALR